MKTVPPPTLLVKLAADDFTGRIVVRLQPYLHFAEDLRQDLEELEFCGKLAAPPTSLRHSATHRYNGPR